MLFSIITVCYNAGASIELTLKSVAKQTFLDYEYIIVDGVSADETLQIIEKHRGMFQNIKVISEPDRGIYDAMNKGAKASSGKYVYFLNAGDVFYNNTVLQEVANQLTEDKDIYYGAVKKDTAFEAYPSRINKLWLVYLEKMVCHQAIFAKRSIFEHELFDLTYKICADREWLVRLIEKKVIPQRLERLVIADYDMNGVSSKYELFEKESRQIAVRYGGRKAELFVVFKRQIGKLLNR